jgi:hypothetical protein
MDHTNSVRIFYIHIVHFLARARKPNQKKAPVSRFILRVAETAGARGNSPAFGGLKQSARFFRPPRRCSARDKGN